MKMDFESVAEWIDKNFGWVLLGAVVGNVLFWLGIVFVILYVVSRVT